MEIFLLVLVTLLLILVTAKLFNNSHLLQELQEELHVLRNEFQQSSKNREATPPPIPTNPSTPEAIPIAGSKNDEAKQATDAYRPEPVKEAAHTPPASRESEKPASPGPGAMKIPHPAATTETTGPFRRWLRDNPDLERFIGENLFNKIGIAILVLGIAFFVKYAIDQEWIGEIGRVCIGLFCGVLLFVLAHLTRKGYHSFSSVLVGGALCVFYFTVAFAFHQYHLLSQTFAFVAMVLITVFAILLSVLYDRVELSVLAALGGFVTPFLVSNGESNYQVLFTYLSILNAGLITLAYIKHWRILNFLGFVFTEVIYLAWMINGAGGDHFPYRGAFIFGSIFYGMFLTMNVIHHAARNSRLLAFDFILLLTVNLAWFGEGVYLLQMGGHASMKGLFTIVLSAINLVLAFFFFKKRSLDRNFVYLLIGLTLSFLSVTAPIQLNGNAITLFWATEAVILFWLYQKSFIRLLKIASAIITILMLFSLIIDWFQIYSFVTIPHTVIANKGFVTGVFCASCLLLYHKLASHEGDLYYVKGVTNKFVRQALFFTSLLLYFVSGCLELGTQFSLRLPGTGLAYVFVVLFVFAYSVFLFSYLARRKPAVEPLLLLLVPLIALFIYAANIQITYITEKHVLLSGQHKGYFLASWLSATVLFALAWLVLQHVRKNKLSFQGLFTGIAWVMSAGIILILSVELTHLYVWLSYIRPASIPDAEATFGKAGLSVLWGICSFALIAIGMHHRFKTLRIVAIVLFGITLLKLFCYDITNISPAGKIIAFILLGLLLLVISFMYQRLKKILLSDANTSA